MNINITHMAVAFAVNIYLTLLPILLHIFIFLCYMSHSDIFCLISISRFQIKKKTFLHYSVFQRIFYTI